MSKKVKVVVAFVLGVLGFVLMFFLGEGVKIPTTVPAAEYIQWLIFISGMGGYFLISEYLLSRGNPQAIRKDWAIILALNLTLLVTSIIALFIEPHKLAALQALGTAILAVACSYAGASLAGRAARQ
jgi:hypothetical protein